MSTIGSADFKLSTDAFGKSGCRLWVECELTIVRRLPAITCRSQPPSGVVVIRYCRGTWLHVRPLIEVVCRSGFEDFAMLGLR